MIEREGKRGKVIEQREKERMYEYECITVLAALSRFLKLFHNTTCFMDEGPR